MKLTPTALFCTLVLLAGPAFADQTVTLQVPVNVQNLHPDIGSISVQCFITPTSSFGRTDLPVSNHAFHGTVNVQIKVKDSNAIAAKGYQCKLLLFPTEGAGLTPSQGTAAPQQAQAKPGTPFVPMVEGSLPAAQPTPRLQLPAQPQMRLMPKVR
jgi:hypothetical protein